MKDRKKVEQNILDEIRKIKTRLQENKSDTVPYDKEAARDAVQKFLALHPDKEGFMKSLKTRMED